MDLDFENRTIRKVFWRLLPFCTLLFVVAWIDRTNIGFVGLQINQKFAFSASVFGFSAGIFYIGYALFEVPSNLVLAKVGARRWIARICITWGFVVILTAWIQGEYSFYLLRFLLGVAEAGFLPGILYYLGNWVPRRNRATAFSVLLFGSVIALVIAGPLGGALMSLDGMWGLQGWQLLMIFEGLPAVVLGIVTLFVLTETPKEATWLSEEEKAVLAAAIARDEAGVERTTHRVANLKAVFTNGAVWRLIGFGLFLQGANFGVVVWLPQIIKSFGNLTVFQIGVLSSGPYALACIAMVLWGWHSDRTGERKWHLCLSMLLAAIGLSAAAFSQTPVQTYMSLSIAAIGITGTFGIFWSLPGDYLKGTAAAGGLAFINSIVVLGAFAGPYVVGIVRDHTPGFTAALLVLAGSAVISSLFALTLGNRSNRQPVEAASGKA